MVGNFGQGHKLMQNAVNKRRTTKFESRTN